MKRHHCVAMLAALICATGSAQEVNVYSTTMSQFWKEKSSGVYDDTYAPLTEFLGVDVEKLKGDNLSFHMYGWGRTDLQDRSSYRQKNSGELSYGYLQYRFPQANAEIKAGRFNVDSAAGTEQIDGVSARTDLRGGFTISGFGGSSIYYKTGDVLAQKSYEWQRDIIFGGRIGYQAGRVGEIGVSFLQDGSEPGKDYSATNHTTYTRERLATDIRFTPIAGLTLTGRTSWDVAPRNTAAQAVDPSRTAEHDYTLSYRFTPRLTVSGNFIERDFYAYYTGTNLPSLFNPFEEGRLHATTGTLTYGSPDAWQLVADYKRTHRDSYGVSNRWGGEVRWNIDNQNIKIGAGVHRLVADQVPTTAVLVPYYSMSNTEMRVWIMREKGKLSTSMDAILYNFDDSQNPNLNGKTLLYELVGSVGYQVAPNLKISGDVDWGASATFTDEVRALVRIDYRLNLKR